MIRLLTALCVAAALFACSTEVQGEASDVVTINSMCPGMGEPVDPECETYDWNGKTVGFCCQGCVGKFADLDDAGKQAALVKVGTKLDG